LCESLIGLVARVDESVKLTLRTQLPDVPPRPFEDVRDENSAGQDAMVEQQELFTRFLEICGAKIDRLDVCLGNGAVCGLSPSEPNKSLEPQGINGGAIIQNGDSGVGLAAGTTLGSVLEHCPRLEALRLSGPLCSAEIMTQVIQGIESTPGHPSSLRTLALGPVGTGVSWGDISHVLGFVGVGAGLETIVLAEGDFRVVPADDRCLALEKFAELRSRGLDIVFAEHRQVGDLL